MTRVHFGVEKRPDDRLLIVAKGYRDTSIKLDTLTTCILYTQYFLELDHMVNERNTDRHMRVAEAPSNDKETARQWPCTFPLRDMS